MIFKFYCKPGEPVINQLVYMHSTRCSEELGILPVSLGFFYIDLNKLTSVEPGVYRVNSYSGITIVTLAELKLPELTNPDAIEVRDNDWNEYLSIRNTLTDYEVCHYERVFTMEISDMYWQTRSDMPYISKVKELTSWLGG